jgi:hypothetical protein
MKNVEYIIQNTEYRIFYLSTYRPNHLLRHKGTEAQRHKVYWNNVTQNFSFDIPFNQLTNHHLINLVGQPRRVAINSRKVKTLPYIYSINQSPINHLTKRMEVL